MLVGDRLRKFKALTVMEETVVNELLDAGSTPASSTIFHKEGPAVGGRNPSEERTVCA